LTSDDYVYHRKYIAFRQKQAEDRKKRREESYSKYKKKLVQLREEYNYGDQPIDEPTMESSESEPEGDKEIDKEGKEQEELGEEDRLNKQVEELFPNQN
jgi:hypothetical protein